MPIKFRMILPAPMPEAALANFAAQIPDTLRRPDVELEFVGTRSGASWMDSPYEWALADTFVLDAGASAEADGCAAVCSFSMSDSGVSPLRSRLSIPVIGAAQTAMALASQLGRRFSIVTMCAPWALNAREVASKNGYAEKLASVRHIDTPPDTHELLSGKEEIVFAKLEAEALAAIKQDGADVIILGSTTMYQSHAYLASVLPCPVVNPGMAAYKMCETMIDLGLTQSKLAYPAPATIKDSLLHPIQPVY